MGMAKSKGENMHDNQLRSAVDRFSNLVVDLPDNELERQWIWGDSEGVHFVFFRTYEQLRELAVKIRHARGLAGAPISSAQIVLAQYHSAYMDLQSLLLGIDPDLEERPPAEGEWSLRRIVAHIVGADLGFYVAIKFALDRHRQGLEPVAEMSNETWLELAMLEEDEIDAVMKGPIPGLQNFHQELHDRILSEFADIKEGELGLRARFWEKEPMALRFRLHRFDSHMRQHTIQLSKTLHALGYIPSEAKRLLRLINTALGEVEGALIGVGDIGEGLVGEVADSIIARTDEIEAVLG
jgi:hypothetical protein